MAVLLVAVGCVVPPDNSSSGQPLPGAHQYPRVLRLHHGPHAGELLAMADGSGGGFWRSADRGRTFDLVASYPDPTLAWATIFELPRPVGGFPAGTVYWAGAGGPGPGRFRVGVWVSTDAGSSWSQLSDCVDPSDSPGATLGGIYEPEFRLTDDDRLVCTFSNETHQPQHSQTLDEAISDDGGRTWSAPRPVVELPTPWDRPGMATSVRLPDGRWVMAYEICGFPTISCQAHLRFSDDGVDWGDPADRGTPVVAPDGALPSHAPYLSWTPAGGPLGTLVLTSQEFDVFLSRNPRSGNSMLVNSSGGVGAWEYRSQPVTVDFRRTPIPASDYDWCSNYSTPVIDIGASEVLQFNSTGDGGSCRVVVGIAAVGTVTA